MSQSGRLVLLTAKQVSIQVIVTKVLKEKSPGMSIPMKTNKKSGTMSPRHLPPYTNAMTKHCCRYVYCEKTTAVLICSIG